MADISKYVSVPAAAEIMGCTRGRVQQLLRAGDLKGEKINDRAWLVLRSAAEKFAKTPAKTGRPRNGDSREKNVA